MKKIYYLSLLLLALAGMQLQAQTTLLSEDFAGGVLPASWTNTGTGGSWSAYTIPALSGVIIGTSTAANGYAVFNADTLGNDGLVENVDLITNSFSCTGQSVVYMTFEDIFAQYSIGQGTVSVSVDGGTTWSAALYTVGPAIAQNGINDNPNIVNLDLSAVAGNQADVKIKFNYQGNWDYWWIIDDIEVYAPAAYDVAMLSANISEFTAIPLDQATPLTPSCEVLNFGGSAVTGVSVATTITNSSNAVVYSSTMTQANLAIGATAALTASTSFTPTAVDFYLVEYVVSITELDNDPTNDTIYTAIEVSDSLFSRDFALFTGSSNGAIGIGSGATGVMGNVISITSPTQLVSIEAFFNGTFAVGDTVNANLYSFSGIAVGAELASAQYIITAADTPVFFLEFPLSQALSVGEYFVGVEESLNTDNMGVLYSNSIYTDYKSQGNINGAAFQDLDLLTNGSYRVVPLVRANTFSSSCAISALSAGAQTACDNVNNEYTQEVVVTFSNAPLTGMLNVNGQTFAIGTSPQTVVLTGLDSDGVAVDVTAFFTDDAACTITSSALFTAPASCLCPTINVNVNTTDIVNCLSPDGSATAVPTGGLAPYTYAWTPSTFGSTATITNLTSGSYSVIVTDNNGCEGSGSAVVNNSSGFSASVSTVMDENCFGSGDGSATVTPNGGTAPFTYTWVGSSSSTALADNLSTGTYSVVVEDANNCSVNLTNIMVNSPSDIVNSVNTANNITCFGLDNGSIEVAFTGGVAPLMYDLDGGVAQSTGLFENLSPGSYVVTVTDNNGCSKSVTQTITEPTQLALTSSSTEESISGASDGTASVTASGGTSPYVYLWDDASAQAVANATGLAAGSYTVTVTDNNGCDATETVVVDLASGIKDLNLSAFTIYPNPTSKNVRITFEVNSTKDVTINFYNAIGKLMLTENNSVSKIYSKTFNVSNFVAGIYFVEVQSEEGKAIKKLTISK